MQDADDGDTETSIETLIEAAEQVEAVQPDGNGIEEIVGDKGYHSNQSLVGSRHPLSCTSVCEEWFSPRAARLLG